MHKVSSTTAAMPFRALLPSPPFLFLFSSPFPPPSLTLPRYERKKAFSTSEQCHMKLRCGPSSPPFFSPSPPPFSLFLIPTRCLAYDPRTAADPAESKKAYRPASPRRFIPPPPSPSPFPREHFPSDKPMRVGEEKKRAKFDLARSARTEKKDSRV